MSRLSSCRGFALAAMCALTTVPAIAADTATPLVPAFPAPLECLGDCRDVLHHSQSVTFVTRLVFPVGSALLSAEARQELLRLLVELESFSVVERFTINGHADPSGPEDFNVWLTTKRAESVKDYFAQSGVDPRTVEVKGHGSAEPFTGAIDPSEHRRIEVRITVRPFL